MNIRNDHSVMTLYVPIGNHIQNCAKLAGLAKGSRSLAVNGIQKARNTV
jgi:hypothetical protein